MRSLLCPALALLALSGTAGAQTLACTVVESCFNGECTEGAYHSDLVLTIDGAAASLGPAGADESQMLERLPNHETANLQVFVGADGADFAVVSLRADGSLVMTVHAGRRIGESRNQSVMGFAQCEEGN